MFFISCFFHSLADVLRSKTPDKFVKQTCLGSFKVISLFSYQCSFRPLAVRFVAVSNSIIISDVSLLVNSFFIFFIMSFRTQLLHDSMCIIFCQDFFQFSSAAFPKALTACSFQKPHQTLVLCAVEFYNSTIFLVCQSYFDAFCKESLFRISHHIV